MVFYVFVCGASKNFHAIFTGAENCREVEGKMSQLSNTKGLEIGSFQIRKIVDKLSSQQVDFCVTDPK